MKLGVMCHLMYQHILLGLTVILLNAGDSDGVSHTNHSNFSASPESNTTGAKWTICVLNFYTVIGVTLMGFLILLSLACHIVWLVIICRKDKRTVSYRKDKGHTRVAGEEELWYATVNFPEPAENSDHVTKFGPNNEYATVVIKTPDTGTPQLDHVDNVEEANNICTE